MKKVKNKNLEHWQCPNSSILLVNHILEHVLEECLHWFYFQLNTNKLAHLNDTRVLVLFGRDIHIILYVIMSTAYGRDDLYDL